MSTDFVVITALSLERRAVCAALGLADENRVTRGGRVYWRGRLPLPDNTFYEIAVAQPLDLANLDAALVTSAAINEWHPQALLFVGIAGAATDEIQLGDVVFGRRIYYYERGKVGNTQQLEPVMYPADAQLLNVAMSKEDWKEPIQVPRPDGSTNRPTIRIGDIASGEKVIAEKKARDELVSRDRRILAIEMEGYGFSSAVWQSANRERHLILRVVCDRADRDKNQDWQLYASAVGAAIMLDFLRDSSVRSQFEPRVNLLSDRSRFDPAFPRIVEPGEPRDIFISHAGEDEKVVERLAKGLEREGFTTWYHERDNTFLEAHLVQTKRAIDRAKAVVVLASPNSVRSHDVTTELQAAHSSAKPVAPLLLQLTWNQIKEQNELWTIIFGAATALTLDSENVTDILPRIVAGLTAMSVTPSGIGSMAKSIGTEYPLPIAATYVHKLGRPWGPEHAVQAHEAIRDFTEAVIAYLAVLVVCRYRQLLGTSTSEDLALEAELENFREPTLGDWARLLFAALGAQVLATDELVGHISKFLDSRGDPNEAISTAAAGLRDWTGQRASSSRSVTNRGFIDLLSTYAHMPKGGWGSLVRLSGREDCQRRFDLLRPALERMVLDLFFLTRYPLVYVQECLQVPDGMWSHQVCDAMGRDVSLRNEPLRSPKSLERSHVYLCRYEGKSLQPVVDLDPLLVFQDCPTCGVPSILLATVRMSGRAEGVSPSCRHRTEWDERRSQGLTTFLCLSQWRARFQRTEFLPYTAALDEVMSDTCEINPEDRQRVNFLAKALRIPDEIAKHLEDQVVAQRRRITEKAQLEKAEREKAERERAVQERVLQKELRRKPDEKAWNNDQSRQPAQSSAVIGAVFTTHLKRLWRENLGAAPTHAAVFGIPPFVFVIDESGMFSIFSRDERLVFRDRVLGRAFTIAAATDRVLVGTWQGGVYCIGPREILWQRNFESPVSRVYVVASLGVLVGTWDGRVALLRQDDGTEQWSVSFDDGISALTASLDSSSLYVGSYSGNLARLDALGRKEWIRDTAAGVLQIALNNEAEILFATRNGVLTCLNAHTQETVWEHFCESPLEDIAFSLNRRYASLALRSGKLQVCGIDGGVQLRAERKFEDLRKTLFSALTPNGRFLSAVSGSQGLSYFDGQESSWTTEVEPPVTCAFVSADGRSVLAGGGTYVELLRLAAPSLSTRLAPLGDVRKGSFTRTRIAIENSGERLARDIAVEFSGPIEAKPLAVTQDLLPGETAVQENHLVRPREDGTIPVRVRLSCSDDRGIQYVFEGEHILDVGRLPTANDGAFL